MSCLSEHLQRCYYEGHALCAAGVIALLEGVGNIVRVLYPQRYLRYDTWYNQYDKLSDKSLCRRWLYYHSGQISNIYVFL
jgi:hypothetical protein